MGKILVHVGSQGGEAKRSSLEVLSHVSRKIAGSDDVVVACVFDVNPGRLEQTIGEYGADDILMYMDPAYESHLNGVLAAGLEDAIRATAPSLVVFASSESVKDILGAIAVNTGAAVLPDVVSFSAGSGFVEAVRPVMAAKSLARVRAEGELIFVSVRSGSVEAIKNPKNPGTTTFEAPIKPADLKQQLKEIIKAADETVDLSEARVVVAAGRGVKDEVGKRLVEELAGLFGGGIGASRAVVETDLFPATAQIGQTGKVVSPDLYFALGISGAIQHVAGMSNSRMIVAINKDADAPIFEYADYGIVGDLYTVVPLLIEEIKRHK
ncbi:MAG: electron transfer flavoprotein subunit alpha/FixB family protein [Bacteroidetes bacterium]|nr:MAG: electron transfer flavoprotein subunit alpha/FixB family protein [Bacteroidota bacterium]